MNLKLTLHSIPNCFFLFLSHKKTLSKRTIFSYFHLRYYLKFKEKLRSNHRKNQNISSPKNGKKRSHPCLKKKTFTNSQPNTTGTWLNSSSVSSPNTSNKNLINNLFLQKPNNKYRQFWRKTV